MLSSRGHKFVWGLALLTTLVLTARPAAADEGVEKSPDQVRKMFGNNCGACHGDFGKKPGRGGPKLAGTQMTEKQAHDRIANGASGTMPSFKTLLTEEQINALVTYIKTLPAE